MSSDAGRVQRVGGSAWGGAAAGAAGARGGEEVNPEGPVAVGTGDPEPACPAPGIWPRLLPRVVVMQAITADVVPAGCATASRARRG